MSAYNKGIVASVAAVVIAILTALHLPDWIPVVVAFSAAVGVIRLANDPFRQ